MEKAFIHFIQTVLVDFKHFQSGNGGGGGGDALGSGESVVADPAEKIVGDTGGATASASDFGGGGVLQLHAEEGGGAADDGGQILDGVVVEAVGDAEAGAKRGAEEARTGGGTDEGEARKIEADGAGGGALINDDIDSKIFDGGIEVLFDHFGEAVDFVDEEDIALLQTGEETGEVTCFFDGRTGSGADGGVHFRSENVSERGFAEAGGATEEEVIEGLRSGAGGVEKDSEPVLEFGLAGEVGQSGGAEGEVDGVARLGIQLFEGLGGHKGRMAKGGKFESGKVTRYAHWRCKQPGRRFLIGTG